MTIVKLCFLGKKSYRWFLNFDLFLFLKGTNRPTGKKITIQQINSLSCTEFPEEYENDPCQVVSLGEKKLGRQM